MRPRLKQLILCWMLLLTASSSMALADMDAAFEAARDDYRSNHVREAARTLKAILLRDPRHKEAAMLLGTIYYQNHKMRKAYYLFEKADPSFLTNENAFAWGATYLEANETRKAAQGFRYILKNRGPFRPYAIYYLGVIAYKSGQWSKARRYFQRLNPEDLSVSLRVNRRRYLGDIRRQQDKMLATVLGGVSRSGRDGPTAPPPAERTEQDSGLEDDLESLKSNSQQLGESPDSPGWRFSVKPSLAAVQQNQLADNHKLTHNNISVLAHREGVSGMANYGKEKLSGGGFQTAVEYNFGNIGYKANQEDVRYFAIEQISGVFASQQKEVLDENSAFVVFEPRFSLYLTDSTRFEIGAGLRSYFPTYDYKKSWGQSSGELALRYEGSVTELGLALTALQPFDNDQAKSSLDFAGRGDFERQVGDFRFSLQTFGWTTDRAKFVSRSRYRLLLADPDLRYRTGFSGEAGAAAGVLINLFSDSSVQLRVESLQRQSERNAKLNRLRASDSIEAVAYGATKSLLSLNIPLGENASLVASGAYHMLSGYHYADPEATDPALQDIVTDVDQFIYQGGGVISLFDWIRFSGSYTVTNNTFLGRAARTPEFRRGNPDYVVDTEFYVELSRSF